MINLKDLKVTELAWPTNLGCEGITFINVVDYLDAAYGSEYYTDPSSRPSYDEVSDNMLQWCLDNDVHYYGAERENFLFFTAAEQAIKRGKKIVLFEDFS